MTDSMPRTRSGCSATFGRNSWRMRIASFSGTLTVAGVDFHALRIAVEPFVCFAVGSDEVLNGGAALPERACIDDMDPHGLVVGRRGVAATRDQPDPAFIERLKPERRRCPADIDLADMV